MVTRSISAVLVAMVATALFIAPAMAADQSIGCVDYQKVFSEYKKTKSSNTELSTLVEGLNTQFAAVQQHRLLDANDRKQLLDLVVKTGRTDKDAELLKSFDDREKALEQELQTLQSKNPPTEQDRVRLKELMDRATKVEDDLAKMNDDFTKQIKAKNDDLTNLIHDDIVKAVDVVAKEKKLTLVFDKTTVLFGGVDVTQAVIDKLNK